MQFTFNPTVSINVSGDLIIPDLAPGSSSDSNIITITAGSNDTHGYTLYGTVGSSSSNYTDLRLSSSNTTNVFTNLSSNKATLTNFSDNTWGYSYSTDSGSSWVSGNAGSTSSGYNGLPPYNSSNNASGVILASTSSASETSLQFKIGAKAASTQVSGTYTNTINFIGVGNVVTTTYSLNYVDASGEGMGLPASLSGQTTNDGVITLSNTTPTRTDYIFKGWCDTNNSSDPTTCSGTTYEPGRIYIIPAASQGSSTAVNLYAIWQARYMQNLTLAACQVNVGVNGNAAGIGDNITVYDKRDEKSYTVRYINGECWMTQNLRVTGTISAADSNFSGSDFDVSRYSLDSADSSYSGHCDTTNGYNYACAKDSGDAETGVWYNYYAASAGTISTNYNLDTAVSSICPKNWSLPTGPGNIEGTDFNRLVRNTTSGWQDPTMGLAAFEAVSGGSYNNVGALAFTGYGRWWSATHNGDTNRYYLYYNSTNGKFHGNDFYNRYYGYFVRCVRSS